MMTRILFSTAVVLIQHVATAASLDFEMYRTRVEPIFLKARQPGEGSGNACATCHTKIATRLRLQPLASGAASWTEEQSRSNFEVVSRLIVPGDPAKSPLLMHPLALGAGGDPMHTGGKYWNSQENPEWKAIAAWARTGGVTGSAPAEVSLDFAFFRERVQPIFLAKRPGLARCINCHERQTPSLVPLEEGVASWNEEQSRKNFEQWKRVVAPGDPLASRLLMHPLTPEAGGDPYHNGGKHWKSQSDPEWRTLADWVRGATLQSQK